MGWTWNTIEDDLKVGLSAIKAFTKENGHSFIPAKAIINGYPIGRWASRRRSEYTWHDGTKRIKEFENIDHWVWNPIEKKTTIFTSAHMFY